MQIHHPHDNHHHHHHHHHGEGLHFHHSSLRSVMLLLALSFHSVFEGIAIGLQDNAGQFLSIVIAVMVHKTVIAFSLGLNIAQSDLNFKSFIISNIIFSLASPLGVGVGILMTDLPQSLMRDICNGTLQGKYVPEFLLLNTKYFYILLQELRVEPSSTLHSLTFFPQLSMVQGTDFSRFSRLFWDLPVFVH